MSENECRGEPCVRPRTKTGIEPMPEGERFIYILDHRFDTGFCSRANIRFAPTSGWHISKWGTYFSIFP